MGRLSSLLYSAVASVLALSTFAVDSARAEAIDVSVPWPEANFHVQNLKNFADFVQQRTDGRVEFVIHSGGSLGIAGADHLRAVRDGLVGAAEFHSGRPRLMTAIGSTRAKC